MEKYYGVDIQKQKQLLLKSDSARPLINEVIKKADGCINKTYEALKLSEYMLFYSSGDRETFNKKHIERRYDALALAAALWLTDDEKYLSSLEDVLFNILDEFTWCVAAHARFTEEERTPERYREEVDLFNARTGVLLCDIYTTCNSKLSTLTKLRIAEELRRRIIEPTKKKTFIWENWDNNWLSYCVVGMSLCTAIFGTKEEMDELSPRFQQICDRYLSGFGEDFCCLEGGSYWGAVTEFFRTAVVLKDASEGRIDLLKDRRVKEIASFQTKVLMCPEKIVAFSDAYSEFSFRAGCISYINKLYPDTIYVPDLKYRQPIGNMGLGMVELLWFDTEYTPTPLTPMTTFFPKSQWFVTRNNKYSFGAKGGYNEEPHNHNDIGSFMASTPDGKVPFSELGTGYYTRQYFEDDTRYKILNNGSHGHSVPIINGEYQVAGKNFCAKNTTAGDNFFETDIAGAYKGGIIKEIIRRFDLSDNGFTMKDTFVFSEMTESFIERILVSPNPVISEKEIKLHGATLFFDSKKYTVSMYEEEYLSAKNIPQKATFLDFKPADNSVREFKIEVIFD